MARTASPLGIRAVFSASEARIDRWRTLNRPRVARESVSTGLVLSSRPRFRPNRRPDDTE